MMRFLSSWSSTTSFWTGDPTYNRKRNVAFTTLLFTLYAARKIQTNGDNGLRVDNTGFQTSRKLIAVNEMPNLKKLL